MRFQKNDGGREAAGYKGSTGDCVVRAISIATGKPYQEVYDALNSMCATERGSVYRGRKSAARTGVSKSITKLYLQRLGWTWTPTMFVGSGCKVHLKSEELPSGRLIVSVSKHLVAVVDGVINDTYDPSRNGTRCVYGYFKAA